ncbi:MULTISPECIES: DUF2778 domain-containing protein [unclassified Pseudoalteromonas]|uniref:DUF2778 domain-containing protein n=1 Tax=unclassified Pseudoalteromonas TaxID=194690 RepID=UPI0005A87AE9|nr:MULTISPECIES: DUF2778 domain-containing protein [unclassified Pseudoalteromonas]
MTKRENRIKVNVKTTDADLLISKNVKELSPSSESLNSFDRLTFDGYRLRWHGASPAEYNAFSGQSDLSARESKKDLGPTPQGLFAIDPANIEELEPSNDWGSYRVKIEPYRSTVQRMSNCFDAIRTSMYIHGGKVNGTSGCIEINDDQQEKAFFEKLKSYGRKIELEVRFVGEMENKLEESKCPY